MKSIRLINSGFFSGRKKGQAFTVFKMMIAAAFAMGLLVLVFNALDNIGCPTPAVNEIENLILQASRTPSDCYERQNICFDEGAILNEDFYKSSLSLNAVTFDSGTLGFCSGGLCDFEYQVTLSVSVNCISSKACTVYIGKLCT